MQLLLSTGNLGNDIFRGSEWAAGLDRIWANQHSVQEWLDPGHAKNIIHIKAEKFRTDFKKSQLIDFF